MARNFAWLAVLGVALLVAQVAAANYVIDVLVPESGVTGSDAAAYQQWRAAAELAEADVNALWASSSDTLTINVLNNLNNGALNSQRAQDTTAIAVIGAGSTALTEQAALILQSRGVRLGLPHSCNMLAYLSVCHTWISYGTCFDRLQIQVWQDPIWTAIHG